MHGASDGWIPGNVENWKKEFQPRLSKRENRGVAIFAKACFGHPSSYMDSSFIASQVFNYLMSPTEIKIAAIYPVS